MQSDFSARRFYCLAYKCTSAINSVANFTKFCEWESSQRVSFPYEKTVYVKANKSSYFHHHWGCHILFRMKSFWTICMVDLTAIWKRSWKYIEKCTNCERLRQKISGVLPHGNFQPALFFYLRLPPWTFCLNASTCIYSFIQKSIPQDQIQIR